MASTLGVHNPLRYRGYVYDNETALYYLQSRYYDPDVGRFINADSLVDTRSLVGHNMFAYCWNNPVNCFDLLGKWTISISGVFSGNFGLGGSISLGIAFDSQGNIEWQYSYALPGKDDTASVGVSSFGIGAALQYTKADKVSDLHGPSSYVGGSLGAAPFVGVELVSFSDVTDPEGEFDGFQISGGWGKGVDVHVTETYTRPLPKITKNSSTPLSKQIIKSSYRYALLDARPSRILIQAIG